MHWPLTSATKWPSSTPTSNSKNKKSGTSSGSLKWSRDTYPKIMGDGGSILSPSRTCRKPIGDSIDDCVSMDRTIGCNSMDGCQICGGCWSGFLLFLPLRFLPLHNYQYKLVIGGDEDFVFGSLKPNELELVLAIEVADCAPSLQHQLRNEPRQIVRLVLLLVLVGCTDYAALRVYYYYPLDVLVGLHPVESLLYLWHMEQWVMDVIGVYILN